MDLVDWRRMYDEANHKLKKNVYASYIREKLLQIYPQCPFAARNNSVGPRSLYIRGQCTHENTGCPVTYKLYCNYNRGSEDIKFTVVQEDSMKNHVNVRPVPVRAIKRQQLKETLKNNTPGQARNKIIAETNMKTVAANNNIIGKSVCKNVNYQTRVEHFLDKDEIEEVKLMKKKLISEFNHFFLPGYIQDIGYDPFNILLFSNLQLEALVTLSRPDVSEPRSVPSCLGGITLHVDATGTVMKPCKGIEKRTYLYSAVTHIKEKRMVIPILDYLSACHTWVHIDRCLESINVHLHNICERKKIKHPIITRVVTDMSFALLKAVTFNMNRMGLEDYLNTIYRCIVNKQNTSPIKVLVTLCYSHNMKRASDLLSRKKVPKHVRQLFLHGLANLSSSQTVLEFTNLYKSLATIFCSEKSSNRIYELVTSIENSNLIIASETSVFSDTHCEDDEATGKSLRESSLFYHHFKKITENVKLTSFSEPESVEKNKYKSQGAWTVFNEEFSPFIPFWANFCFLAYGNKEGLLTNGIVEGHFRYAKTTLQMHLNRPAEIAEKFAIYVKAQFEDLALVFNTESISKSVKKTFKADFL